MFPNSNANVQVGLPIDRIVCVHSIHLKLRFSLQKFFNNWTYKNVYGTLFWPVFRHKVNFCLDQTHKSQTLKSQFPKLKDQRYR